MIKKDIIYLFPNNSYNNYTFFEIGKSFSQITLSKNIKFLLKSYFLYYLNKKNFIKSIRISIIRTVFYLLYLVKNVYLDYNVSIASQNFEVLLKQFTKKGKIRFAKNTPFFKNELVNIEQLNLINKYLIANSKRIIYYEPYIYGLTRASLLTSSLISQASSRETSRILIKGAIEGKLDFFRGIKENIILGNSSSLTTFNKVEESVLKLNNLKLLKAS